MKKTLCVLFVLIISVTSVFAATRTYSSSSRDYYAKNIGFGLNVGYPGLGLAVRYRNYDFRFLGAISTSYAFNDLSIDATGEYAFARLYFNDDYRNSLDFSAGLGLGAHIPFSSSYSYWGYSGRLLFGLAFEAGLIMTYNFPTVPISLFLRGLWKPELMFCEDNVHFALNSFGASIGFTFNFDLR